MIEEEILYNEIVKDGQENKIEQVGKYGKKKVTKKITKDEQGNIMFIKRIKEEVVEEPVDEIRIEKSEPEEEEVESTNKDWLVIFSLLGAILFVFYKIKIINQ